MPAIPVAFDPSCRFVPTLAELQKFAGPDHTVQLSQSPSLVLHGPFPVSWWRRLRGLPAAIQRGKAKKLYWTGENTRPDFEKFDWCVTFDYDDIVQHPNHCRRPVCPIYPELLQGIGATPELLERRFCNFLYSQPNRIRERFFDLLSAYKPVDAPGARKNNMPPLSDHRNPILSRMAADWPAQRLEFIKNYKFTIAFENASYPGYATEKLWHTLLCGSVPIYWGNPLAFRDFNPRCYINVHDFSSLEAVVERVVQVDSDPELYLSYFSEPPLADPQAFLQNWETFSAKIREILIAGAVA